MDEICQKRRNAHYNSTPAEPTQKSRTKVWVQLVFCMLIVFLLFTGSARGLTDKQLPDGRTAREIITQTLNRDIDLQKEFGRLRDFVSRTVGTVALPIPETGSVFNETTPTASAEN